MKTTTLILLGAALIVSGCSAKNTTQANNGIRTEVTRYHVGGITLSSDVADRRYPLHGGKFGK